MRLPGQLPARLLKIFDLPETEQKGDLVELLCEVVRERVGDSSVLLVLDNLDDLVATTSPQELRGETRAVVEKLLGVAPRLRILATCRWPIGLAEDERIVAVLPLSEEDARDVFLSHLEKPEHVHEVRATWGQEESPARRLIRLSGRHPQSLRLLVRQLRRPGLSLERLCAEAHENLLGKLVDPYAAGDEEDRRYKVERSYELSYRHLSDAGQLLFARLARFPSGIWCGDFPEQAIGWHEVLGEDWKVLMERDLDFFALVHFEDDRVGTGFYRMLPSMLELARKKLSERRDAGWCDVWITFWRVRLKAWNKLLEGKVSNDLTGLANAPMVGEVGRQAAIALFSGTQVSWLELFDFVRRHKPYAIKSVVLNVVPFTQWVGQRISGLELAQMAVIALRALDSEAALAACLGTLGNVQSSLGEHQAAAVSYGESLEIYRSLAYQHPAAFDADIAMTLNNLGNFYSICGEWEAAAVSFGEALEIYRRLASNRPSIFEASVAMTLNNLGNSYSARGEREAAAILYGEALEIYRRLASEHPAAFEADVAMVLNNIGTVQSELGEREAAAFSYARALEIRRRLANKHPAVFDAYVAGTLNNLGAVQRTLGEREAARLSYTEALTIYAPLFDKYPLAYAQDFAICLYRYTKITPETPDDPWWQRWHQLNPPEGG